MKRILQILSVAIFVLFVTACTATKKNNNVTELYKPDDKLLYDSLVYLDSVLFEGYNTCKLDRFEKYISENIEFYHDKGGLSTSKKELIEALKNNICGKVTRELVKGSIEVYPIAKYGAVQMGSHRFHNIRENSTSRPGKFVHTWQRENGEWKITRIISLH